MVGVEVHREAALLVKAPRKDIGHLSRDFHDLRGEVVQATGSPDGILRLSWVLGRPVHTRLRWIVPELLSPTLDGWLLTLLLNQEYLTIFFLDEDLGVVDLRRMEWNQENRDRARAILMRAYRLLRADPQRRAEFFQPKATLRASYWLN